MPVTTTWTPGEWRVLELVAEDEGWDFAMKHAASILEEARSFEGDDLDAAFMPPGGWPQDS